MNKLMSDARRELFYSRMKRDKKTGCLVWTGTTVARGYGQFSYHGRRDYAHRLAWLLAGQEIPADKPVIRHRCPYGDNPLCCEISHLRVGTSADNNLDTAKSDNAGRRNESGLPRGVKRRKNGRLQSRLTINSRCLSFGCYDTVKEAAAVSSFVRDIRLGRIFLGDPPSKATHWV